jgi:hypothetical protein
MLFWNPLCAGMLVGYVNLCLSLEGGLAGMNQSGEISCFLHLYNELKKCGKIEGDLPLVSDIDRALQDSKLLWNGWEHKPGKGELFTDFI